METKQLKISVIGAGLGGLSTALALRQQGHIVSLYDRVESFALQGGGGLGIVSNSTRLLEGKWNVDLSKAGVVPLKNLAIRDWKSSEVLKRDGVGNYKARFGYEYYGAVRWDVHRVLLDAVCDVEREGKACEVFLDHRLESLDIEGGICRFTNGVEVKADLVIGADGIKSETRNQIGINPQVTRAPMCCYRFVVPQTDLETISMSHLLSTSTLNFWPGPEKYYKLVAGPADHGRLLCFYAFFSGDSNTGPQDLDWQVPATVDELKATFPDVDPNLHKIFELARDLHVWRYTIHEPYPYWWKGRTCLLGDATHPMLPDQNQGFSQAVEDAAALGAIFSKENVRLFEGDVSRGLMLYEKVRKERATTIQAASLRASEDIKERFGFKDPSDPPGKLTIEWLCEYDLDGDVRQVVADFEQQSIA